MSLDLLLQNLLSPPILFFLLGAVAARIGSDMEVPPAISRLFSIYLLWAIGFKGGVELRVAGAGVEALLPLALALLLSVVTTIIAAALLRRFLRDADAFAVGAAYGSVSVTTFVAAANFLAAQEIEYGGQMVAALALMEAPPIMVAIALFRRAQAREHGHGRHRDERTEAARAGADAPPLGTVLRHAMTSGPVFLLVGSLVCGVLSGEAGYAPLKPFLNDVFYGVLVLFLLDAGLLAGSRLDALRRAGRPAIVCGILMPLAGAAAALGIARLVGLGVGDAFLLMILAASASYIAVPAAMRDAIPEADPGLYLPMAIAVTFPFNVCLGIPLYLAAARAVVGGG